MEASDDPAVSTEAAIPPHRVRGLARASAPPRSPPATSPPPDPAAELAAEKEARARDSAMLGEMFARAVDADAKRRTAEQAAQELTERVAELESELREIRARRGASVAAVAQEGEARARVLEDQLRAAEEKAQRAEDFHRTADERARAAERASEARELEARAAKERASTALERIGPLEDALRGARKDREEEQSRAMDLARKVDELSALAAQATEARGEAEAVRRRSAGIETELARVMKRAAELERDVTATRAEADAATKGLGALRTQLEAARSALESEARARQDAGSAARSLLAALEVEEQQTTERRRKDLAELRAILGVGEGVPVSTAPGPISGRPASSPSTPARGTLTGMHGVLGDHGEPPSTPVPRRPSSSAEALKAAVSEAAKRK